MTDQADRSEPLSQRILSEVRGRILSGEWAPGHRIPFEHELAAAYGCSRMTANKAMAELAKAGLIERRRRSGSFVRRPRSQAAILEIHDIRAEVEALGMTYRYELISRSGGETKEDDDIGLPPGTEAVRLLCRHFGGGQPFCREERAISLAAVPDAAEAPFEDVAPGSWLLGRIPWSTAEHTIRAISADAETAAALGTDPRAACLVVERLTWSGAIPVTGVRLTYPGDTHSLVARFTPSQPR